VRTRRKKVKEKELKKYEGENSQKEGEKGKRKTVGKGVGEAKEE
jgi:hypothetical protein